VKQRVNVRMLRAPTEFSDERQHCDNFKVQFSFRLTYSDPF
jgi:hypothetical protein